MSGIAEKIAKASGIVGGKLKADARNKEQGYDYISADKIISVCGQALADVGVMIAPQIDDVNIVPVERQGKGPRYDVVVKLSMTITDGEAAQVCQWVGMGSDYLLPDKAMYKAITSGHRYFLAKLLNVGEGNEDGEHEAESATQKQAATAQPQRQPAQTQRTSTPQPPPVTEVTEPPNPFEDDSAGHEAIAKGEPITENQLKALNAYGTKLYGDKWDEKRHQLVETVTKGAATSSKMLSRNEATQLIEGMKKKLAALAPAAATVDWAKVPERISPEELNAVPEMAH